MNRIDYNEFLSAYESGNAKEAAEILWALYDLVFRDEIRLSPLYKTNIESFLQHIFDESLRAPTYDEWPGFFGSIHRSVMNYRGYWDLNLFQN